MSALAIPCHACDGWPVVKSSACTPPECTDTVQDRIFVNEAQVFNDAGLSFDVWTPPSVPTVGSSSVASPQSSHAPDGMTPEKVCAADNFTGAAAAAAHTSTSSKGQTESSGSDPGMTPGYLLAVKFWKEAVETAKAANSAV